MKCKAIYQNVNAAK